MIGFLLSSICSYQAKYTKQQKQQPNQKPPQAKYKTNNPLDHKNNHFNRPHTNKQPSLYTA